jgi:hypothetical protein
MNAICDVHEGASLVASFEASFGWASSGAASFVGASELPS